MANTEFDVPCLLFRIIVVTVTSKGGKNLINKYKSTTTSHFSASIKFKNKVLLSYGYAGM